MQSPIEIVPGPMTGTLTATVLDPNGVPPGNIIRTSDNWNVKVQWTLKGTGAAFVTKDERWLLRIFVESIGPGPEALVPPGVTVNAKGGMDQAYDYMFTFPPNADMARPDYSGVYKLIVVLTLTDDDGHPLPIAGFFEGPVIQFYRPS